MEVKMQAVKKYKIIVKTWNLLRAGVVYHTWTTGDVEILIQFLTIEYGAYRADPNTWACSGHTDISIRYRLPELIV